MGASLRETPAVFELSGLEDVAKELWLLPRPEFRASSVGEPGFVCGAKGVLAGRTGASPGSDRGAAPYRDPTYVQQQLSYIPHARFASGGFVRIARGGSCPDYCFGIVGSGESRGGSQHGGAVDPRQTTTMSCRSIPGKPGGGGGGGGDHDKMDASHGTAPRFAAEQLTPPLAVVRNEHPALPAEPTLVGPPDIVLPQSDRFGDPMANILNPPSNGTGSGGGIGSGEGGGIGSGTRPRDRRQGMAAG